MEKKTGIVDRVNEYSDLGFKQYRRKSISEMRPYQEGEILDSKVSISEADKENGSPKLGDMIARNPLNHNDQWLVAEQYFKDNLEALSPSTDSSEVSEMELDNLANVYADSFRLKIQDGGWFEEIKKHYKAGFELRSKLKSQWVSVVPQVCAKCNGEGYCDPIGTSSSVYRVCPVCNGSKLIMPVLLPTQ